MPSFDAKDWFRVQLNPFLKSIKQDTTNHLDMSNIYGDVEIPYGSPIGDYPLTLYSDSNSNAILNAQDYKGKTKLLWHGKESTTDTVSHSGGFRDAKILPIDPSKAYRIIQRFKLKTNGGPIDVGCRVYFGLFARDGVLTNAQVLVLKGKTGITLSTSNVYYNYERVSELPTNVWLTTVGYIYPNDVAERNAQGGIYNNSIDMIAPASVTRDVILNDTIKTIALRSFLYNAIDGDDIELVLDTPELEELTPTSRSLAEVVNDPEYVNKTRLIDLPVIPPLVHFEGAYGKLEASLSDNGMVTITGLLNNTSGSNTVLPVTLITSAIPVRFRPTKRIITLCQSSPTEPIRDARIDIPASGEIELLSTVSDGNWVNLNVTYPTKATHPYIKVI